MRAIRWIAAVPVAFVISVAAWFLLGAVVAGAHEGGGILTCVIGLSPIVIRSGAPTLLFVVSAVVTAPSRGRKPPFVFFALAVLISGGGIESLPYYDLGLLTFWITSFVGVLIGAIVGLLLSLKLQSWRTIRQNQDRSDGATAS